MRLTETITLIAFLEAAVSRTQAFSAHPPRVSRSFPLFSVAAHADGTIGAVAESADDDELAQAKAKILAWVNPEKFQDPVLADPVSKEPVLVSIKTSTAVEDLGRRKTEYVLSAETSNRTYSGSSVYINLLEPTKESTVSKVIEEERDGLRQLFRAAAPLVPPPFRFAIDEDYVPMRDLFTSPAVSFAYERGWRQGFQQAGFPGPDREAKMAMEYFEPSMSASGSQKVLVDMSCATGLFTRRFAQDGNYSRILGCDYSDSMLREAKRRINQQWKKPPSNLELIRLDVGQIPMQDNSVDALHAGAAMHCWPDLPAAVSEIYRVLRPGGRYFATTFLSSYFANLQSVQGDAGPSRQAFQYFGSTSVLRSLLEKGGFSSEKLSIEVLGSACVVIRGEK